MRLWLDDVRPAPEGWTHARTARQAIAALSTGRVREISLDHDLGEPELEVGCGYEVCMWMEESVVLRGWRPPAVIKVHSANPVGRRRMLAAIERIRELSTVD